MDDLGAPGRRSTRVSRDVCAGLFLVLVGGTAFFSTGDLALSDSGGVGPGLVPRSVSLLIAAFGVLVAGLGLGPGADRLERWSLRGPLFVLGAVAAFAAGIRPLGLAVAGPMAVVVAAFADPDSRVGEVIVFAVLMSALCVALFKYILRLPIPLAPILLGY